MNVYERAVACALETASIFIAGIPQEKDNEAFRTMVSMAYSHSERPFHAREILNNVLETLDFYIALQPKKRQQFQDCMHGIFEHFWDTL